MKSKLLIFFLLLIEISFAQKEEITIDCGTEMAMKTFYKNHPDALVEHQLFNAKSKSIFQKSHSKNNEEIYILPVVFHVYGTLFNGRSVNDALIELALENVNKDFQGLNDDYDSVDAPFLNIRGKMNIQFQLAKLDPDGNPTTGVIYYDEKSGYGDDYLFDEEIAADAWDNYKYINVYIQNDLYNDGNRSNSGVAWYPNTYMSDHNLARIVYNGAYLATNTSKEFASVLTHEFGHFLNLYHTFEGGCEGTDEVDDTPQEDGNHSLRCSPGTNCDGTYINVENYMGYNGANGCYKMFTDGQIQRMTQTLEHPSREPLWQFDNLIATGIDPPIVFPELKWITEKTSYNSDGVAFFEGQTIHKLEIKAIEEAHLVVVKGPHGFEQTIQTENNEVITIPNLTKGIWTVEIPSLKKMTTKLIE